MKTVRLVLPESISERDVGAAAWNNDWSLIKTIKADENTPHEVIWQDNVQDVAIHYIKDFYVGLAYLVLRGDDLEPVIEDVHNTLPTTYKQSDVLMMLEDFKNDPENLAQAIYCFGLIAPQQFDLNIFSAFEGMLAHSSPIVRSAAIVAIGYVGWAEFKAVLKFLQKTDSDLNVRKDAEVMLSGFELYLSEKS